MALNRSCLGVGPTPISRRRHPGFVEATGPAEHEPSACRHGSRWAEDGYRQIGRRDDQYSSIVSKLVRKMQLACRTHGQESHLPGHDQ